MYLSLDGDTHVEWNLDVALDDQNLVYDEVVGQNEYEALSLLDVNEEQDLDLSLDELNFADDGGVDYYVVLSLGVENNQVLVLKQVSDLNVYVV